MFSNIGFVGSKVRPCQIEKKADKCRHSCVVALVRREG